MTTMQKLATTAWNPFPSLVLGMGRIFDVGISFIKRRITV